MLFTFSFKIAHAKYFSAVDLQDFHGLVHLLPLSEMTLLVTALIKELQQVKFMRGLTEERTIFIILLLPDMDGG